jgi:hypothetical protein
MRRITASSCVVVVLALATTAVAFVLAPTARATAAPGFTTRITDGAVAPTGAVLSADGRTLAFTTTEALSPLATPGLSNIYVRDLPTGRTTLLTQGRSDGTPIPAGGDSRYPSLSADGRYVAFETTAANLGTTDHDSTTDVVIADRAPDGDGVFDKAGGAGYHYTYAGQDAYPDQIYRLNATRYPVLNADATELVWIYQPQLRTSAYHQPAQAAPPSPIQPGDKAMLTQLTKDSHGTLRDPTDAQFSQLDATVPGYTTTGVGRPSITAGSSVATAPAVLQNLSGQPEDDAVLALDLAGGPPVRLDLDAQGAPLAGTVTDPVTSATGNRVAFTLTPPGSADGRIVVIDRDPDSDGILGPGHPGEPFTSSIESRDTAGNEVAGQQPALSADGRYLAFVTAAPNVHEGLSPSVATPNVVARDLVVDAQRAASHLPRLPAALASPSIAADCESSPPPPGSTCPGDGASSSPTVTADGSSVAFLSAADDLVPGDTNETVDAFVRTFTPMLAADAGAVRIAQDRPSPVTAQQVGFGPLPIASVRITGADAGDFTVYPAETCSERTLYESESCTVSVRFTPTAPGVRTGSIEIAPVHGSVVSVMVSGSETTSAPPGTTATTVGPAQLDFGTALVAGTGPPRTVTVRNTGKQPVRITTVGTIEAGSRFHPHDYAVASSCTGASLAPGQTCAIDVRHTPQAAGDRPAVLQIDDTAAGGRHLVLLTGAGAVGAIAVSPAVTRPESVVAITGTGFPADVAVTVVAGSGPERAATVSGPDGSIRVDLVLFPKSPTGSRAINATSAAGSPPVTASAPLLVEPGTLSPPDLVNRN